MQVHLGQRMATGPAQLHVPAHLHLTSAERLQPSLLPALGRGASRHQCHYQRHCQHSAPVPLHRQRWQLVQGLLFCLLHGGSAQQTRWHMVVVMRGRCCCGMATHPLRAGAGPYPGSMPTASGASWCHCDVTSNVSHSSPSLLSLPSFPRLKPLIRNLFSHQF